MVEDAIWSIFQALTALGVRYTRITSQGGMYIRLLFQIQCYTKQDPPPSQVKPIPLQVLCKKNIIFDALGDPVLPDEYNKIIVASFFLFRLGYYTGSKSYSTPFHLEDVALRF